MNKYEQVMRQIDASDIAGLALDLVKIPSPTGKEMEVAKFYASVLELMGLEVRLDYVEKDRPNVVAKVKGKGTAPSLMLHGHLDTVPIGNCVSPMIDQERVFGRGSCDMKGSLAAMAAAAKAIEQSDVQLGGDLLLVGTVDHESPPGMGKGVRSLAKRIRTGDLKVSAAINTEGPMDAVKVAQGGCALFTVSVVRKAGTAYSATSSLRSNPILWTGELIKQIEQMDAELERKKRHPMISSRPTVQVGIVEGGDFVFTVPDLVRLEGAVRWDPDESFQDVASRVKKMVSELEIRLRREYDPSARMEIEVRLDREACELPSDERIVRDLHRAIKKVTGLDLALTGTRYVTDLSVLYKEAGIAAVEFGPFLPNDITNHTDHESVRIDSLKTLSSIYATTAYDFLQAA